MERPLSPFMLPTWYRFQITSLLSILLLSFHLTQDALREKPGTLGSCSE